MKIEKYKVLHFADLDILSSLVVELSEQGYTVQGGIGFDTHRKEFIQSMIKFKRESWE